MAYIKSLEMRVIEQAFGMGSGYVLSFSDTTFAAFINDGLNIDIDDPKYVQLGTSKPIGSRAVEETVGRKVITAICLSPTMRQQSS